MKRMEAVLFWLPEVFAIASTVAMVRDASCGQSCGLAGGRLVSRITAVRYYTIGNCWL